MGEYTVEFRIYGKDLIPSSVTADLGLTPSTVQETGQPRGRATPFAESMWGYSGFPDSQPVKIWGSLEEGIEFMLKQLLPLKDKIDIYKAQYKVMFWCGHFQQNTFGEETIFPPSLLSSLGDFNVKLILSSYYSVKSFDS